MAALSPVAANVKVTTNVRPKRLVCGEAIVQGECVYQSSADSKVYKADANDGMEKASAIGIATQPGATDEYTSIALTGLSPGEVLVNLGATLTVGQVYCVGTTPGTIVPYADLTSSQYVTILGVARTAALLDLQIVVSDTLKP